MSTGATQGKKVKVTFTQNQIDLLENLRKEGTWGKDYGEIISRIVHECVRNV